MEHEKGPGLLSDGWFREENEMWPGQAQGFKVEKIVYDAPSEYQHLTVFETDPKGPWGTVMVLDGVVQLTDFDEFVYHEMLANLSLNCHPNPEEVLVVGGGDGGVLREVLRHKKRDGGVVANVELVDIDPEVIRQSEQHFPQISCGFKDPCSTVTIADACKFVETVADNSYDVIIIDSTDPKGPGSGLFGEPFYRNIMRILRPGGIICNQAESMWVHRPFIEQMVDFLKNTIGFGTVKYAMMHVPSYPCGSIGTLVCAKAAGVNVQEPLRRVEDMKFGKDLKYYSSDMHRAAFVLPPFAACINK